MNNEDLHIIQRVLRGDERAFAKLVDRHKDKAMTLAVRMLKNRIEAEEAVQDSFVRAFRALSGFQGKSNFSTWFYRIVYNVCSTALSKRGKEYFVSIESDNEAESSIDIQSMDETPDIQFEGNEFAAIVKHAIDSLGTEYASILTLFYIQDLGYEEIVEVTGLPIGTVKNRLFRARTELRKLISKTIDMNYAAA